MQSQDTYADWFRRITVLGILINLFFAIPAIFYPDALIAFLGFQQPLDTLWVRNVGMLLVLLCLFYAPVTDVYRQTIFAQLIVAARLIAASFWMWLMWCVESSWRACPFMAIDLLLGIVLHFLLRKALRQSTQAVGDPRYQYRRSLFSRACGVFWASVNRIIPWHWLPRHIGSLNLQSVRSDLREHNLHDTAQLKEINVPPVETYPESGVYRTPDGSATDPENARMGRQNERFARNVDLNQAWPETGPEADSPSPREISLELMTRHEFKPAETLNLLAAAWIQFMNHGWFNHARSKTEKIEIPLAPNDSWRDRDGNRKMHVPSSAPDPTRPPNSAGPPTYLNTETHWWDGSQIYGSTEKRQRQIRSGRDGKLRIEDDGWLPIEESLKKPQIELTGFNDNWWVGLSLLHTLFTKEHNTICDRLKSEYGDWDDDRLFNVARLINAALMAKIHTVEWTPGILGHPTLQVSMNANWWGLLGENFKRRFGRVSDSEAISGIVGSPLDHHSAPFALTEEFVAVYRLHPLIPDDVTFHSALNNAQIARKTFHGIEGANTRAAMEEVAGGSRSMTDLFYSLGIANPGAITLHNFPKALQNFERVNGDRFDLAAVDILRDRERGVPRYNDFREMLRMPRIRKFKDLTDNPRWAEEIRRLYRGDIDRVDLMVGMYAEPVPKGFGFSDTAFRIFILMASRRLKSDRFFTTKWNADTYTQTGLDWVNDNDMISVLLRHHPKLSDSLRDVKNGFAPWNRASASEGK